MNEFIGYTIKTHDNAYVGQVTQVERTYVHPIFRKQFEIEENEPYVALAVQLTKAPKVGLPLSGVTQRKSTSVM